MSHHSLKFISVIIFLFLLHSLIYPFFGVLLKIQQEGKLESGVNLRVHKCIHIEHNPLQVHYKYVRKVGETKFLSNVLFFLTNFTKIIIDFLILYHRVQTFLHRSHVFYSQGKVVEKLVVFLNVAALHTLELGTSFPAKDALGDILIRGVFETVF